MAAGKRAVSHCRNVHMCGQTRNCEKEDTVWERQEGVCERQETGRSV